MLAGRHDSEGSSVLKPSVTDEDLLQRWDSEASFVVLQELSCCRYDFFVAGEGVNYDTHTDRLILVQHWRYRDQRSPEAESTG